jgi:hypothetical protein
MTKEMKIQFQTNPMKIDVKNWKQFQKNQVRNIKILLEILIYATMDIININLESHIDFQGYLAEHTENVS